MSAWLKEFNGAHFVLIHVVESAEFAPGVKQTEDGSHNPPKVVHSA